MTFRKLSRALPLLLGAVSAAAGGCYDWDDAILDPFDQDADAPPALVIRGLGSVLDRHTAEVWVHGTTAYTTTWGRRTLNGVVADGNAIKIWDVTGAAPQLVDSVIVASARTLGDVEVSPDGKLLVVATEPSPGSIVIYDLANPRKPVQLSRFTSASTTPGVHTAEIQHVNGKLYAFLSVDPGAAPARLVIVDISNPSVPVQISSRDIGDPYQHDVFVRDGILLTAEWHDGMGIYDIGGGGKGGSPANPVEIGRARTVGGSVHNVWWYHDAAGGKRYAVVGEEAPADPSSGDIHIVDVSNLSAPVEVAFFHVPGAGTHNFWMDETRGLLYAAYYNAGVRVLDLSGNLASCAAAQKAADGRCDLGLMGRERARGLLNSGKNVFVWGVHGSGGSIYASDMDNGLWKLGAVP